ncbi:MAG: FAD-linked oxidase C-terminal domain-containing protein, partial [Ramlibacter sp.]
GLHKMAYLEEELGADTVDVMRRIKQALDPNNILNPGKVVSFRKETS